jgi:site-specific DNA recombinase
MMSTRRKAVTYIRVSTDEQANHGYSIDGQKQVLRDYAAGHELEVVQEFVESESAFKPGRPEFAKMLQFIRRRPDVVAVLVYKIDRLARNIRDYAELDEMKTVSIISATEGLPENATGKLVGVIQAGISRYYSEQLSERVKLAMATKAARGLWPSLAPTGYLNDPNGPGIIVDPERADLVRALFERYAAGGISVEALSDWAARNGLRTRKGGAIRTGSLHRLIQNPIYYGTFRWHEKEYEGNHEPLISRSLFDRVQEQLNDKGHMQTKRFFPYRGIITCGYCGSGITAALAKGKYVYYRCTEAHGRCEQRYVREERLGDRLLSVVESVRMTRQQVTDLMNLMEERRGERARTREERLGGLKSRRDALARRREAAYEDKLDGRIGEERWSTLDRKWGQEDFQLKCEAEAMGLVEEPSRDDIGATLELLQRAPDLYIRQSAAERARLLKVLVWNCAMKGEDVSPVYRKPFDLVAQGVSSAVWYPRQESNL